jgi:DNA-binding CsgD family transcriptional regulator
MTKSRKAGPMSKLGQRQAKPMAKKKLKTMNEISAAEAVKLFQAAMVLDDYNEPGFVFEVKPSGFPDNIAARDFFESLNFYKEMWREGRQADWDAQWAAIDGLRKSVFQTIEQPDPDGLFDTLSPAQKRVYTACKDNPNLSNKEIAAQLNLSPKTLQVHLESICATFNVRKRRELFLARPMPPAES